MNTATKNLMTLTTRTWMLAALVACAGCANAVTGMNEPIPSMEVTPPPDAGSSKPDAAPVPAPVAVPDAGAPDVVVAQEAAAPPALPAPDAAPATPVPDAGPAPVAPDAGPQADAAPLPPVRCQDANGTIHYACNGLFSNDSIDFLDTLTKKGVLCLMYSNDPQVGACATGTNCWAWDHTGLSVPGTCL